MRRQSWEVGHRYGGIVAEASPVAETGGATTRNWWVYRAILRVDRIVALTLRREGSAFPQDMASRRSVRPTIRSHFGSHHFCVVAPLEPVQPIIGI